MAAAVGGAVGGDVGGGVGVKVGGKVGVAAAGGAAVAVGVGGGIVGAAVGGGGMAQAKAASSAAIPIRTSVKDFRKDRAGGIRLLPKGILQGFILQQVQDERIEYPATDMERLVDGLPAYSARGRVKVKTQPSPSRLVTDMRPP